MRLFVVNFHIEERAGLPQCRIRPEGATSKAEEMHHGPVGMHDDPVGVHNGPVGTHNGPVGTHHGPVGTHNGPAEQ